MMVMSKLESELVEPTTIGGRLKEQASRLVVLADSTAERAEKLLGPILDVSDDENQTDRDVAPTPQWPEYFDDMRGMMWRVERALVNINSTLSRLAL